MGVSPLRPRQQTGPLGDDAKTDSPRTKPLPIPPATTSSQDAAVLAADPRNEARHGAAFDRCPIVSRGSMKVG